MLGRTLAIVAFVGLVAAALSGAAPRSSEVQPALRGAVGEPNLRSDLVPENCAGPAPFAEAALVYRCGLVLVDREDVSGAPLRLWVEVIGPQTTTQPPIVMVPGGPSRPGTETFEAVRLSPQLASGRDLIFFDPRGTGMSGGHLTCSADRFVDEESCFEDFAARTIDRGLYSGLGLADDLEALRWALGSETWSVWGSSYGAEIAQHLALRHGASIDALVLAAPTSIQTPQPAASALAIRDAVHATLDVCESEPSCSGGERYLTQRLERLLHRTSTTPLPLSGPSGDGPGTWIDAANITAAAWWTMSDWTLTGRVGALLFTLEQGDPAVYLEIMDRPASTGAPAPERHPLNNLRDDNERRASYASWLLGHRLILCNDGLAGFDPLSLRTGSPWWDRWQQQVPSSDICADVGIEEPLVDVEMLTAASFTDLRVPPVLVLAGRNDDRVSLREVEEIRQLFPAAVTVALPWYGHLGMWEDPCPQRIAARFLATPTEIPDTTCIADLTFENIYGEDCDRVRGLAVPASCPHSWYNLGFADAGAP